MASLSLRTPNHPCTTFYPCAWAAAPHRCMVSGVRRCPWFKDDPDAYVLAKTRAARKSRQ